MNLWPRQWWPHTLGAQLVAVTAAAVIISNLAVAAWFELGRERLSVSSQNERLLDRAVSVVTLLAATQPRSREDAVKTLSSGPWQFRLHHDKPPPEPMNEEEASLAARARALLPEARRKEPIIVHIGEPPAGIAVPHRRNPPDAIQVDLPVVRGTRVEMTFFRPPPACISARASDRRGRRNCDGLCRRRLCRKPRRAPIVEARTICLRGCARW